MPIYKGNQKVGSIYYGDVKIGKGYKGATQFYQSGVPVTYHVDTDVTYTELRNVGDNAGSPTTFTPEKEGWTFVGWNTSDNGFSVTLGITAKSEPITLYAVFTQTVKLTYAPNFGSLYNTTSYKTATRHYNNGTISDVSFTLLTSDNCKRTDYELVGWTINSVDYDPGSTYTVPADVSNFGAVAKWKQVRMTLFPSTHTFRHTYENGYASVRNNFIVDDDYIYNGRTTRNNSCSSIYDVTARIVPKQWSKLTVACTIEADSSNDMVQTLQYDYASFGLSSDIKVVHPGTANYFPNVCSTKRIASGTYSSVVLDLSSINSTDSCIFEFYCGTCNVRITSIVLEV